MGGELRGDDVAISGFATDSRAAGENDLFIAIRGANVDGRDFIPQVPSSCALAEPGHPSVDRPAKSVIVVDDVVEALASLGRSFRDEFDGPVVGITGSVGKSTVKELVAAALTPLGKVTKTEGNRNTEYTAPLMWAEVDAETQAVVVEMGMRGLGQIAHLASISRPTIGVITNIGITHLSELGSREAIAQAKSELIEGLVPPSPLRQGLLSDNSKVATEPSHPSPVPFGHRPSPKGEGERPVAVIWADDFFRALLEEKAAAAGAVLKTFGTRATGFQPVCPPGFQPGVSDATVIDYRATDWNECRTRIQIGGREVEVVLPNVGRHFALGSAAALLVAEAAGVDVEEAAKALSLVQLPPMRMAIREHEGITWVLDMYNAAPVSTVAAMETVAEVATGPKFAVLGEMRELGEAAEEGHRWVGKALADLGFEGAITLDAGGGGAGPTRWIVAGALEAGMSASNLVHAASFEEVREWLCQRRPGDTILVKGSRGVELEKVVPDVLT